MKPYDFKANGKMSTPYPIGEYNYTVYDDAKTFKISGWVNEWVYTMKTNEY